MNSFQTEDEVFEALKKANPVPAGSLRSGTKVPTADEVLGSRKPEGIGVRPKRSSRRIAAAIVTSAVVLGGAGVGIAAADGAFTPAPAKYAYKPAPTLPGTANLSHLPQAQNPMMAMTGSDSALWADGDKILATSNDGANWSVQYPSAGTAGVGVTGLDVVSNQVIWAFGGNGLLLSNDAGVTWIPVSFPYASNAGNNISNISFENEEVGYLLTRDNRLFATSNGGVAWTQVKAPVVAQGVCSTSRDLWLLGGAGVYKSTDAGATWQLNHAVDLDPVMAAATISFQCSGSGVWVTTGSAGAAGSHKVVVDRSVNSGNVWAKVIDSSSDAAGAPISSALVLSGHLAPSVDQQGDLQLIGDCGTCTGDSQNGQIWLAVVPHDVFNVLWSPIVSASQNYPMNLNLEAASFFDSLNGIVVVSVAPNGGTGSTSVPGQPTLSPATGPGYEVLATSDGGKTWRLVANAVPPA